LTVIHLLFAALGFWLGALLGAWLVRWCFSCRKIGHAWERYQIEGAHYRDPAALPFRMCTRCGHHEILEPPLVTVPAWDPFDSLGPCPSRKPPPTEEAN
jgi:hypothetical protein